MSSPNNIRVTESFYRFCEILIALQNEFGVSATEMCYDHEEQKCTFYLTCPVLDDDGHPESWDEHHVILQDFIESQDDEFELRKTSRDCTAELTVS